MRILSYKECNVLDDNTRLKFSLSIEPAFQVIYWSICWLAFFLFLILALETQTISLTMVSLIIIFGILLFFGLGSTLKIKNNNLKISYFRGIKKKSISLDELTKITFSDKREINVFLNQDKEEFQIYLNKKNKKKFYEYLKTNAPLIQLEQQDRWDELSKYK